MDNLEKRKLPIGEQEYPFSEDYSFFQTGEAHARTLRPAPLQCAAPLVRLRVGKDDSAENSLYVPPVAPTSGGNCETAPQKHIDLFFAEEGREQMSPRAPERRDFLWGHYCHDCPVREACFEYAASYIDWGIWAGTTEAERKKLRGKVQEGEPRTQTKRAKQAIEAGKRRLRKGLKPLG